MLALIVQVVLGLFLAFDYDPEHALTSIAMIEHLRLYGKLVMRAHNVGATIIFALVYAHLAQKTLRQGYRRTPKSWWIGCALLLLLLLTSVIGQVLHMNQRGYWGLIIMRHAVHATFPSLMPNPNILPEAIDLKPLFWLHVLFIPVTIALLSLWHVFCIFYGSLERRVLAAYTRYYLHYVDKRRQLGIMFTVFFVLSNAGKGLFDNSIANPLATPADLSPAWYIRPFYAVLQMPCDPALAIATIVSMFLVLMVLPLLRNWIYYRKHWLLDVLGMLWLASLVSMAYGQLTVLALAYYFCYFVAAVYLMRRVG